MCITDSYKFLRIESYYKLFQETNFIRRIWILSTIIGRINETIVRYVLRVGALICDALIEYICYLELYVGRGMKFENKIIILFLSFSHIRICGITFTTIIQLFIRLQRRQYELNSYACRDASTILFGTIQESQSRNSFEWFILHFGTTVFYYWLNMEELRAMKRKYIVNMTIHSTRVTEIKSMNERSIDGLSGETWENNRVQ